MIMVGIFIKLKKNMSNLSFLHYVKNFYNMIEEWIYLKNGE